MSPEEFNSLFPVGTPVIAYPLIRPEHRAGGLDVPSLRTVTITPAWLLGGHKPVVMVEGYASSLALTHVDPVTPAGAVDGGDPR